MKHPRCKFRPIPHFFDTITYQERATRKKKTRCLFILLCTILLASIIIALAAYLHLQEKQFAALSVTAAPTQAPLVTASPHRVYAQIDYSYTLLVNSTHPLADEYTPNLVAIKSVIAPEKAVCREAAEYADPVALQALEQMLSDAISQGYCGWVIRAAYRSQEQQQTIWDETYEQYQRTYHLSAQQAYNAVLRRVEMPGYSEHETGLAFDLGIDGDSSVAQCEWLREHCTTYGFIIRYTANKENLTGIGDEPWHIRYVGSPHAERMKNENLCLEEYATLYIP